MKYIKKIAISFFWFVKKTKLILFYKYSYLFMNLYSKKNPLEIFEDKNILIVTAHPDDEVFCIAHVLKEIQTVTKNISWINTTLGQNSIDSKYFESTKHTANIRELEFIKSMEKLNVDKYLHLKIPSYLSSEISDEIMSKIQKEIKNCDYLFLIDKNDQHPDHYFSTKSFEKLKNRSQIFYYNVQKVTLNKKLNYFYSNFNEQLFNELIAVYKSQSHMKVSFDSYKEVFNKKVFIYNENIN